MDKDSLIKNILLGFGVLVIFSALLFMPKGSGNKTEESGFPLAKHAAEIEFFPPVDKTETRTVKVLLDDEIVEMGFEEYLVHVVAGEMYPDYSIEALRAQAVTARTYTYKKLRAGGCGNKGAQICDDINHCQAYKAEIKPVYLRRMEYAVYSTKGEIIVYNGEPITALYHSTSGGYTEDNVNVFGENLPYLKSVKSEGEESSSRYKQEEVRTVKEIKEKTKTKGDEIKVLERYPSGRVRSVDVFGKQMTGKQLRELLKLSSANFEIHIDGDNAVFTTIGYGHGVGMSQVGANYMAENGKTYEEIIKHYYTGVELSEIS